jgi:hypothetical protein
MDQAFCDSHHQEGLHDISTRSIGTTPTAASRDGRCVRLVITTLVIKEVLS